MPRSRGLPARSAPAARSRFPKQALSLEQAAEIARAWSLVHGFTMLLLDGRLSDILRRLPEGTDAETLLDAMLKIDAIGQLAGGVNQRRSASSDGAAACRRSPSPRPCRI